MSTEDIKELFTTYGRNITLLIVDDDGFIRTTLSSILGVYFKEIDLAENGEEAFELFKKKNHDLIISDISMPIIDGIELATKIREVDKFKPIVIMSGHDDSEYLLKLINLNVDQFIRKPIKKTFIESIFTTCEKIHNEKLLSKYTNYFGDQVKHARKLIISTIQNEEYNNYLKKENFEVIFEKDKKKILDIAYRDTPNIIILDEDNKSFKSTLLHLKSDDKTKHIWVVTLVNGDYEALNKQLFVLGIDEIIPKEFGTDFFIDRLHKVMEIEKFSNSYTNKFIRGIVQYESTTHIGMKMRSLAGTICYHYKIPQSKTTDIENALTLLSTTFNTKNIQKTISFYDNMNFAKPVRELLEEFESAKTIEGNIIKGIYYVIKQKVQGINKDDIKKLEEIEKEVLDTTLQFSKQNTIFIQRPKDVDYITDTVSDVATMKKNIETFKIHELSSGIKNVIYNLLIKGTTSLVSIKSKEDSIIIEIEPQGEINKDICIKKTNFSEEFDVEIVDNKIVVILTPKKIEKTTPLTEEKNEAEEDCEDLFLDIGGDNSGDASEEKEIISAKEFINRLYQEDHNLDLLDELEELEEDLYGATAFGEITLEVINTVITILQRYSRFIESLYEFREISSSLYGLTTIFQGLDSNKLSEIDKSVLQFLEAVTNDLKNWREGIFVYKSVDNIHFLDNSFISSCAQIEIFLTSDENTNNMEDDAIFF